MTEENERGEPAACPASTKERNWFGGLAQGEGLLEIGELRRRNVTTR